MHSSFKEECVSLREAGHTLTEIVEHTGRSKTSVYFHIRHIPLSEIRRDTYRRKSGERIKKYALARKGKSTRKFKKFDEWTPEAVLLISHFIFDGSIQKRGCEYNNRSNALIARVKDLMGLVYEFPPKEYVNSLTGVKRLTYYNVELGPYIQCKADELLGTVHALGREQKRSFLRAFFDDEGCMDFRPMQSKRRVRGYQNEPQILATVQGLLREFNIESTVLTKEVFVAGKKNLIQFQDEIGFSPGIYVNGNRSNSIWKKEVEKRILLENAINSYTS